MILEQARWMSPAAQAEVALARSRHPDSFRYVDEDLATLTSGAPNLLIVGSVCHLGLLETFRSLQAAFGVGVNGEGTRPANNGYKTSPLVAALLGHRYDFEPGLPTLPLAAFLLDSGATVNPPPAGVGFHDPETPVQASVHHTDALSLVLAHGADVTTTFGEGNVPFQSALSSWFMWAQQQPTKKVLKDGIATLKTLLDHGADPCMAVTSEYVTPGTISNLLVRCAEDPKLRTIIGEIVSLGIDPSVPGPDGMDVHRLATEGSLRGPAKKRQQMQAVLVALERHTLNTTLSATQSGGTAPMRL